MNELQQIVDRQRVRETRAPRLAAGNARGQLLLELVSGGSGLVLALFMWGHMFFVASILTGTIGFDWIANGMEVVYIAQPTVIIISALFLLHALTAVRKVPAQLRERRRFRELARGLKGASSAWVPGSEGVLRHHVESWLWLWQVRTGLIIIVLGSFHLVLMMMDIFTPLYGDRIGIEAVSSMARTQSGLVWMYAVLLLAVEFHAGVGLYRLAIKWGAGSRLSRRVLWRIEGVLFWFFIGLGTVVLIVLAGWLPPPLAFLTGSG